MKELLLKAYQLNLEERAITYNVFGSQIHTRIQQK